MTTTIAALATRARRLLIGTQRDQLDWLAADINTTDVTLTLELGNQNLTAGQIIEIGFEPMYVKTAAGTSVTVRRAMEGSTAVAHVTGDLVRINPTFTSWDLFRSMQEELVDLSSPQNGLYRVLTIEVVPNVTPNVYDLADATTPAGIAYPLDIVRSASVNPSADWHALEEEPELLLQMAATDAASGTGVRFTTPDVNMRTRLWVRAPYGDITVIGNAEDSGMMPSSVNILAVGAAFRMAIGRELARSMFERQGDTRRGEEVPPGAQRQGLTPFAALRQEMISAERARLQKMWSV